jgi:protein O-GlcNAc transferase
MFCSEEWQEVRLDVDPANSPDILASLLDMSPVADASVEAIFSSHTIEHLYPGELRTALDEFLRVLKPDGFVITVCPDLQSAAEMIAQDRLFDVAYESPSGPVTPFDIVYSHRKFTRRDNPYMSHYCGFTLSTLAGVFREGGFPAIGGYRDRAGFQLCLVAFRQAMSEAETTARTNQVLK